MEEEKDGLFFDGPSEECIHEELDGIGGCKFKCRKCGEVLVLNNLDD